ncbi:MAG: STAS domain-containing protein [Verrucomicrobiales bacterium]|nr:STAS domain-containing protein [Verrucomicrobiales bacterium]MCP5559676.1 STAS domain-containing protein [Verrucomicrobiaceae bacterium]
MNTPIPILVGKIGAVFWVRVEGRGTFQNSVPVKQVLRTMMDNGSRSFVVDLERCPLMDSTFLGTLTGAALNLRELGGGHLSILNANQRNQQLMTSLGLDYILEVDKDGTAWPAERAQATARLALCPDSLEVPCKEAQSANVLDAHQTLADLSEENECRFRDVIDFLQRERDAATAG